MILLIVRFLFIFGFFFFRPVGDFTIAINEKNGDIGCAAVRFKKDFYNHFSFVCNFPVGNLIGQPIYTIGDEPTVDCRNRYGASYDYPNLCHIKENYNYRSHLP